MPGVTSQNTLRGQPTAANRPVPEHRLPGVLRARRREPARRQVEWRDNDLVAADHAGKESRHRAMVVRASMISARRSRVESGSRPGRTLTTMSSPTSWCCVLRNSSRTHRLQRFRSTARTAALRPITIPSRASSPRFGCANASTRRVRLATGEQRTARYRSRPERR